MPRLKKKPAKTLREKKKQNLLRQKQREKNREGCGPTKKWEFGCFEPIQGKELMEEQFTLAHNLYNKKIEIEREKRSAIFKLYRKLCPELKDLDKQKEKIEEELEKLYGEIRQNRVTEKKKTGASKEQQKLINEIKAKRTALQKRCKELRSPISKHQDVQQLGYDYHEKQKAADHECGKLFWGTKQLVCESIKQAASKQTQPRFQSRRPGGTVSVQVQKYAKSDSFFYLEPVNEKAWTGKKRGIRKKNQRTRLWIRVGPNDPERTNWVVFPMILHRPIPPETQVKRVSVSCFQVGTNTKYKIYFDLEFPKSHKAEDVAEDGTLALDYGWRSFPDGSLRVVAWRTIEGDMGELILPEKILNGLEIADSIRGIRDDHFNDMKNKLQVWKKSRRSLPQWLKEELSHIHQWKSQKRLVRLVRIWKDNRCKNDDEIMRDLEEWRKQDRHLYDYECGTRYKCIGHRKDLYRNFAAWVRRNFKTVIIEGGNRKRFNELPAVEKPDTTQSKVRYNYRVAAISKLYSLLEENITDLRKVNPANTSKICSSCGTVNKKLKNELIWNCESCGVTHDRDHNATKNILARGLENGT